MAFVIWFTGLPSSGKTTLGGLLYSYLVEMNFNVEWLDSDELRKLLTPKPKYTLEEREWFYTVLTWIAETLYRNGVSVIISATATKRRYRDRLRCRVPDFIEVYLKCSLDVCIERDVKGVYRKALEGVSNTVPGIGDVYEPPYEAEIILETDKQSVDESFNILIEKLRGMGFL